MQNHHSGDPIEGELMDLDERRTEGPHPGDEVRCDSRRRQRYALINTSREFRPSGASILPFWLSAKSAVIEFRCRGTPWVRKIATNNFGTWEMSAYNAF